ncbi:hypothetical protein B0H67DRAFT_549856 [Lasiosphaeris hirsuta]|uniref:Uncharacterized protein n=1 Tax=Lasiosphaeris hirsuta TaxID=260670 RepID=A0AA40BDI6_9PEZI|nr:hypothetical protein B0H67DRAFT_549856 [Lasiosphaeris hirsuta]
MNFDYDFSALPPTCPAPPTNETTETNTQPSFMTFGMGRPGSLAAGSHQCFKHYGQSVMVFSEPLLFSSQQQLTFESPHSPETEPAKAESRPFVDMEPSRFAANFDIGYQPFEPKIELNGQLNSDASTVVKHETQSAVKDKSVAIWYQPIMKPDSIASLEATVGNEPDTICELLEMLSHEPAVKAEPDSLADEVEMLRSANMTPPASESASLAAKNANKLRCAADYAVQHWTERIRNRYSTTADWTELCGFFDRNPSVSVDKVELAVSLLGTPMADHRGDKEICGFNFEEIQNACLELATSVEDEFIKRFHSSNVPALLSYAKEPARHELDAAKIYLLKVLTQGVEDYLVERNAADGWGAPMSPLRHSRSVQSRKGSTRAGTHKPKLARRKQLAKLPVEQLADSKRSHLRKELGLVDQTRTKTQNRTKTRANKNRAKASLSPPRTLSLQHATSSSKLNLQQKLSKLLENFSF